MSVETKKKDVKEEKEEKIVVISREKTTQKINIDPGLTYDEALVWITKKRDEENQPVQFSETIDAYPTDGAFAVFATLKQMFGWVDQPQWGTKPELRSIEVGYQRHAEIPWGKLAVPGVQAIMSMGSFKERGVWKFQLVASVIRKDLPKVKEIVANTRDFLSQHSIYKGHILRLEWNKGNFFDPAAFDIPKFLPPANLRPEDLILPEEVYEEVDAGLFSLIQNHFQAKSMNVPDKRLTLLAGVHGTGKTMAMAIVGDLCRHMGRTSIYLTDVSKLPQVITFAQQYSPAMVVGEDIDAVDPETLNAISNAIDAVDTKNMDVMFTLTTNHLDKLPKKFLRNARTDMIIEFQLPDAHAVARLILKYGSDFVQVSPTEAMELGQQLAAVGMIPASIREVVERSKLFAIAKGRRIANAHDIKLASRGVTKQVALLNKKEPTGLPDGWAAKGIVVDRLTSEKGEELLIAAVGEKQ